MKKIKPKTKNFKSTLLNSALIASIIPSLLCIILLIQYDISVYLLLLAILILVSLIAFCQYSIQQAVDYQFKTLTNLVEAMLQSDYSMRYSENSQQGSFGELVQLINQLAHKLQKQKIYAKESRLLLTKVISQIDVAVIIFNEQNKITLANPAAVKLYDGICKNIEHSNAKELGLAQVITENSNSLTELPLKHATKNFYVRCDEFFEQGQTHKLVLITDIHKILREEERQAWKNLLRVLGHEINNSLSPITSISDTLIKTLGSSHHTDQELLDGLSIIKRRASSLDTFIQSYQDLARLPKPTKQTLSILQLWQSLIPLFTKHAILLQNPQDLILYADPAQLEQVFVNLLKNADEAMEKAGTIHINWWTDTQYAYINIKDEGPGISNFDNLFVPFYTTKKKGSGIGLTLARQILYNHNGDLNIRNRSDCSGAEVFIKLPCYYHSVDDKSI